MAVTASDHNSLALRTNGSILARGESANGETNVPAPNSGFVVIAAGIFHSLGLKADGSVIAWQCPFFSPPCDVPEANTGFVAIAAGYNHSVGLKGDGSIIAVHISWTGGTAPHTLRRSRNPQFTQDVVTLVDERNDTSYDDPVLNDGVNYYYDVQ
jgi:alpha-tubulin suppressor-like RCC1 family protein